MEFKVCVAGLSVCLNPSEWVTVLSVCVCVCPPPRRHNAQLLWDQFKKNIKKRKPSKKNKKQQQQNMKAHICSPPSNLPLAPSAAAPATFWSPPPTSIEKINAIHYHYRQEEIQGQREWNASRRFFWHIHHICDERGIGRQVRLTPAAETRPGKTLRPERLEVTPTLMF